jgi:ABC-2 type transport system permease protein
MSRILTLARLNFLQMLADRTGLITMLVLPIMLTFLFGTMMGGGESQATVAFADQDGSSYSRELAEAVPSKSFRVARVSEEEARAMTSSGEAAAAIIVPAGFGADVLGGVDTEVTVVTDPRYTSAIAVVQAVRGRTERIAANGQVIRIVRGAFRDAGTATGVLQTPPAPADVYSYASRLWSPEPPVSVDEVNVAASKVRGATQGATGFQQYSLGFTLMFMLFMGMGSAGGFLDDREYGTLARLLTTPTSKVVLITGKVAGIYVTVLFEAAVMVGFGAFAFGVPWGDDPLGVMLVLATFGLAATGLGVMASTLVRTRGQMSAVMAVSATALSMLGGAYWPLDIVSPAMRTVAYLTPTGWAMQGLTDIVVRAQGPTQAALPALVLTGMAVLFLSVGISRLRLE